MQATDGEVDFLEGAEEFVEMIRLAEGGQVEHDADPNPGADVGRAGREVTKFLAEGDVEVLFEAVVEVVDLFPGLLKGEAGTHDLDSEMVFFVDHDGCTFVVVKCNSAWAFALFELT